MVEPACWNYGLAPLHHKLLFFNHLECRRGVAPSGLPSVTGDKKGMKIKHSHWFAAGSEVNRALMLLSDGAFRLYFYLCLQASRDNGSLTTSYVDIARALGRSRRSVASYFEELRRQNVCQLHPAANQHQSNIIQICDEFWPYTKSENRLKPPQDADQYFVQIRSLLAARACVRCAFNAPDRKFAATLMAADISLQQIERAVALGCSRKYISFLNGTDSEPIVSLAYFRDLIEEAGDQETPADYWDYVKPRLERLEAQWLEKKTPADANIASATRRKKQYETR
jgi:hypothetical protein